MGRPPKDRVAMAKAFAARRVYNRADTRVALDRLQSAPTPRRICGWERAGSVPSASTFSRAFAEFAAAEKRRQDERSAAERLPNLFGKKMSGRTTMADLVSGQRNHFAGGSLTFINVYTEILIFFRPGKNGRNDKRMSRKLFSNACWDR